MKQVEEGKLQPCVRIQIATVSLSPELWFPDGRKDHCFQTNRGKSGNLWSGKNFITFGQRPKQ